MLEAAEAEIVGEDEHSYRVRNVRAAREAYEIARRIPLALVGELAERKTVAQQAWAEGQRSQYFAHFAPHLAHMVRLNRELADAIGYPAAAIPTMPCCCSSNPA